MARASLLHCLALLVLAEGLKQLKKADSSPLPLKGRELPRPADDVFDVESTEDDDVDYGSDNGNIAGGNIHARVDSDGFVNFAAVGREEQSIEETEEAESHEAEESQKEEQQEESDESDERDTTSLQKQAQGNSSLTSEYICPWQSTPPLTTMSDSRRCYSGLLCKDELCCIQGRSFTYMCPIGSPYMCKMQDNCFNDTDLCDYSCVPTQSDCNTRWGIRPCMGPNGATGPTGNQGPAGPMGEAGQMFDETKQWTLVVASFTGLFFANILCGLGLLAGCVCNGGWKRAGFQAKTHGRGVDEFADAPVHQA